MRPAACQVEPAVSRLRSSRTASVQPRRASSWSTLTPTHPPPTTTTLACDCMALSLDAAGEKKVSGLYPDFPARGGKVPILDACGPCRTTGRDRRVSASPAQGDAPALPDAVAHPGAAPGIVPGRVRGRGRHGAAGSIPLPARQRRAAPAPRSTIGAAAQSHFVRLAAAGSPPRNGCQSVVFHLAAYHFAGNAELATEFVHPLRLHRFTLQPPAQGFSRCEELCCERP